MGFLLVHVTYKLLCTGPPQRSSPCMLISLIFVKFRTHVTDFLFTDWQRNRTCGDQCCFLLGSHSKVPRGNWFLRALMSYFRVRFQLNGYIFPQIGRVWTSHLLKIVPSLLGGLAGSVQTSWPLIWTISCKRGAVPCACKNPFSGVSVVQPKSQEGRMRWCGFQVSIYAFCCMMYETSFFRSNPGSEMILRKRTRFMACVQWYIRPSWLMLHSSYLRDFLLKYSLGFPCQVAANPSGAVGSLAYICQACASWTVSWDSH